MLFASVQPDSIFLSGISIAFTVPKKWHRKLGMPSSVFAGRIGGQLCCPAQASVLFFSLMLQLLGLLRFCACLALQRCSH
jgi:hypothetical protein